MSHFNAVNLSLEKHFKKTFPFNFQLSGNDSEFFVPKVASWHVHIFRLLWAMPLLATPQAIERSDKKLSLIIDSGFV